jgi:hypothetical protein
MKRKTALEQRIARLEKMFSVPGTTIFRALNPVERLGLQWGVGVGPLSEPKVFAYGNTIGEAFDAVEAKLKRLSKP